MPKVKSPVSGWYAGLLDTVVLRIAGIAVPILQNRQQYGRCCRAAPRMVQRDDVVTALYKAW
jgi:hypothetical protein